MENVKEEPSLVQELRQQIENLRKENQDLKEQLKHANKQTESAKNLIHEGTCRLLTWKDFPEEWRSEFPLAAFAMRRGQACYEDFVPSLQGHTSLLWSFLWFGDRKTKLPQEKWRKIPVELQAEESVVLIAIACHIFSSWYEIPKHWRNTASVVLTASIELPESSPNPYAFECWRQPDAVRRAIECGVIAWERLPDWLQQDDAFARSLTSHHEEFFVQNMVAAHPELRSDLSFWRELADCENADSVFMNPEMFEFMDPIVRSDKCLMLRLCHLSEEAFSFFDEALLQTDSFCQEALQANPRGLPNVSRIEKPWVPLVVEKNMSLFASSTLYEETSAKNPREEELGRLIPDTLLSQRNIMKAWLQAGLHVSDSWHTIWSNDRDMALFAATYCRGEFAQEFADVFEPLLDDEILMAEVVEKCPLIYSHLSQDLQSDADVAVAYFASANRPRGINISMVRTRDAQDRETNIYVRDYIDEQLNLYKNFFNVVLFGLKCPSSPIALLDQGSEAKLAFKKNIAEFAGVPTGKRLRLLRLASQHWS